MIKYLLLAFACFSLYACKKNSTEEALTEYNEPTAPIHSERGKTTGAAITTVIGPAGGTLQTSGGTVTITVPAGAVTSATTFSIQPVENTLRTGKLDQRAFRLLPENLNFNQPVTVKVKYDPSVITTGVEDVLRLAYQTTEGYWKGLPAVLDKNDRSLTVMVNHFCDFAFYEAYELLADKTIAGAGETVRLKVGVIEAGSEDHLLAPLIPQITSEFDNNGTEIYSILHRPYATRVLDWKLLTGTGTLKPKNNGYLEMADADYNAPETISQPDEALVEVQLEGIAPIPDPSAPGGKRTPGQLWLRKAIKLLPSSYMQIQVDGKDTIITDALLAMHANGLTSITGIDNSAGIGIDITFSGSANGGYSCGDHSQPGKAFILMTYDNITSQPKLATSVYCESTGGSTVEKFSGGNVNITQFGAVGQVIEGSFTGTLYAEVPNGNACEFTTKHVSVAFRIIRTGG